MTFIKNNKMKKFGIKNQTFTALLFSVIAVFESCNMDNKQQTESHSKGTFGYDLQFLNDKDSLIVLKNNEGNAQVIVSGKYQGKVFTSTAKGLDGKSFGWINYEAFKDELDPHMNAYGGENRLWLGPEGNKYSIYFAPGKAMEFENWHTPPTIDTEAWEVISADSKKASLSKKMSLTNYAGTLLEIQVDRTVEILENQSIEKTLGISLPKNIDVVGFKTDNYITNAGQNAWDEKSGAPCMWNLDMFSPSEKTIIVIPYQRDGNGKVATTDYFGQIPADRFKLDNGTLFFKADGKSRGKLGINPKRALPIAGSFDPQNNVLTITTFDVDNNATYLNQEWSLEKDALIGDAVNAYNDGPLQDGKQMGPFYEIESVSPAAFLKPNEKLTHQHSVYHFTGNKEELNIIAKKLLNISLKQIESAF